MTYKAIVCRIHVRPHPNADRLQLGLALGNQVVVGLDTQEGELGAYFASDGQLSEQFSKEHDLVGYTDPATGKRAGGYFAANRRVRAQRFRGEKSDGYWVPVSYFAFTGVKIASLREGDQFSELNGVEICSKYITPATARAMRGQGKQSRGETTMFRKHFETEQFRFYVDQIPAGAYISITEKLHGTSHRLAHVIDNTKFKGIRNALNRLLGKVGLKWVDNWKYLHGSRNVILDGLLTDAYYKDDVFRRKAVGKLEGNLHKGEVVYGEIVGYVSAGVPIMSPQDTTSLKDKAIEKKYGPKMTYSYGLADGECEFYVYRIAMVNEEGKAVELSWNQVKARCSELGVKYVPELTSFVYDGNAEALRKTVDALVEGDSILDARHIREGVCIRVEHPKMHNIFKHKSFAFGVLEGFLKEKDEAVDREEIA